MYPREQLDVLALRKKLVQARIAARRQDCARYTADVMRPVRWVDEAVALCRAIAPRLKELALPLGLFVARRFAKPGSKLGKLAGYAALAMQLVQTFMQPRENPPAEPGPGTGQSAAP